MKIGEGIEIDGELLLLVVDESHRQLLRVTSPNPGALLDGIIAAAEVLIRTAPDHPFAPHVREFLGHSNGN